MPLIQKIDERKFIQKTAYSHTGSGLKSLNSKPLFLHKQQGGSFDIASFIPMVSNAISENKDTISAVASSVGSVANAAKSISDTIKTSKELEKIKTIQKKTKKNKDVELTPEQVASLKNLCQGFVQSK